MVMRADGTHARYLTRHPDEAHADFSPQWAPNGKRLVWQRYSGRRDESAIFTVRVDGSGLERLTPWRMKSTFPDWSPNGRWILFTSASTTCGGCTRTDGLRRITENPDDEFTWSSSSFSPDGRKIVTSRSPGVGAAGNFDVYVMNLDGSGYRTSRSPPGGTAGRTEVRRR